MLAKIRFLLTFAVYIITTLLRLYAFNVIRPFDGLEREREREKERERERERENPCGNLEHILAISSRKFS